MTGLGLPPGDLDALLTALDRATVDGVASLDPGRIAAYLRRRAAVVTEECSEKRSQTTNLPDSPHWTVAEAADQLGVSVHTVRRRCATGRLPGAVRPSTGRGRGWLIPAGALTRKEPEHG